VWLLRGPTSGRLIGVVRSAVDGPGLAIETPPPPDPPRYYLLVVTRETYVPTSRPDVTVLEGFVSF